MRLFIWYLQYFRGSLQVVTQIYEYLPKFPNQQLCIFILYIYLPVRCIKFIKEFPEYSAAIFPGRILHNSFHSLSKHWMIVCTKIFRKKISNIYISDLVPMRTIYPITRPECTNKFLGGKEESNSLTSVLKSISPSTALWLRHPSRR